MTYTHLLHQPWRLTAIQQLTCLILAVAAASRIRIVEAQVFNLWFENFTPDNTHDLSFSQDSSIQNGALQVTFDTGSTNPIAKNSAGRVTYSHPVRIWDEASNHTATINTSFLVNLGPINAGTDDPGTGTTTGGGIAFLLSAGRANDSVPDASSGEWLGLFNSSLASGPVPSSSRLLAVELDTFKDSFDPDSNHVGIDTTSPSSVVNVSLSPFGVVLNRNVSTNTSVWIDYDGVRLSLDVYISNASDTSRKPSVPVISQYPLDLRQLLPSFVYVGFSASSGTIAETHCVLTWNLTISGVPEPPGRSNVGLIVGLSVGCALAILAALLAVMFVARKRRSNLMQFNDPLQGWTYGPRKFGYRELKKATNGFSEDCLLGEGGFGAVYRGTLQPCSGSSSDAVEVAVKRLSQTSKQGVREFAAEVTIIGRLRHKNLVRLLGWSQQSWFWGGGLMLVYEFMPNGSLDQWLGTEPAEQSPGLRPLLDWKRRYHVLKGLAAGLLYLHEEWEMVVVHRDIKPSNVMLDGSFNARLGDFGLARLSDEFGEGTETKTIAGTPGYMAPECLETGVVTTESDVYSFGAVAIQVATGRRPSSQALHALWVLRDQTNGLMAAEAADPRLGGSYNLDEMELVLMLGLACCHPEPFLRPSIRHVSQALSSSSADAFSLPSGPFFRESHH